MIAHVTVFALSVDRLIRICRRFGCGDYMRRPANCIDLRIKRQIRVDLYAERADVIRGASATATVPALMVVRRCVVVLQILQPYPR